MKIDFPVS
jgi:hypothetical protein